MVTSGWLYENRYRTSDAMTVTLTMPEYAWWICIVIGLIYCTIGIAENVQRIRSHRAFIKRVNDKKWAPTTEDFL